MDMFMYRTPIELIIILLIIVAIFFPTLFLIWLNFSKKLSNQRKSGLVTTILTLFVLMYIYVFATSLTCTGSWISFCGIELVLLYLPFSIILLPIFGVFKIEEYGGALIAAVINIGLLLKMKQNFTKPKVINGIASQYEINVSNTFTQFKKHKDFVVIVSCLLLLFYLLALFT